MKFKYKIIFFVTSFGLYCSLESYTFTIKNETGEEMDYGVTFTPTNGYVYDTMSGGKSRTFTTGYEGLKQLWVRLLRIPASSDPFADPLRSEITLQNPRSNYIFTINYRDGKMVPAKRNSEDTSGTFMRKVGGLLEIHVQESKAP